MTEWIVTSSVLIGIVLVLRWLLKRKISMRLRYGLWLLVLVRLLIPLSLPSGLSIMNLFPEAAAPEQPKPSLNQTVTQQPAVEIIPTVPNLPLTRPQQIIPTTQQTQADPSPKESDTPLTAGLLLTCLWIAGMIVTGSVFIVSNIHFALRLKRSRQKLDIPCRVPVYHSAVVSTPCIHGLLFPKLYLPIVPRDDRQLPHILAHETTHLRHLDHIWALLRCICLVAHWYNPLVWLAAVLSRQDGELACDEAAVRRLGEEQRSAYGQTLIQITCTKNPARDLFLTASTMLITKKSLKERITMIVKKPKTTLLALLIVILTAVIAVGCTFTGKEESKETTPQITFRDGQTVYVREKGGFGSDFTITLHEDGTFTYSEGTLSSYFGWGSWQLEDNLLTLTETKLQNTFLVEEGALVWLEKESIGFTYGALMSLTDCDRFVLQGPQPPELSSILNLSYLPQDYLDGGLMGCFVQVDDVTYVWDHNVVGSLEGLLTTEIGKVASCNNTVMPSGQLAACRIPVGTVLYKGRDAGYTKYEAIYYKLEDQQLYARLLPTEAFRRQDRWWETQAEYTGKPVLTADALRKLQQETDKKLTQADLKEYSFISITDPKNALEYWIFQVDRGYRLKLVIPCTDTEIEPLEARFYLAASPSQWIDLITTDIDAYQSNLTATEQKEISKTEVVYDVEGFVTVESLENRTPCRITLEKNCEGTRHLNTQLAVTTSAGTFRQIISTSIGPVIPEGETLYLADLDGDSDSEIILQEDLGGCGGYGTYRCRVFQVDNNGISEMFNSEPEEKMDTGFYWEICDQYKFQIHNRITGDAWELKADEYRRKYYFDELGKVAVENPGSFQLWTDSFYEIYPKDIDGDGVYELCTTQYTFDRAHVDGVGDAKCVFKYDNASNCFRIIETDFVPYTE